MRALVMILKNTTTGKYHPIMYFESPFPGHMGDTLIRYKSKGHHTTGIEGWATTLSEIASDLVPKIESIGYTVTVETDPLLEWDGNDIPADIQIRTPKSITI